MKVDYYTRYNVSFNNFSCYLSFCTAWQSLKMGFSYTQLQTPNSSLHWLVLVFFYALSYSGVYNQIVKRTLSFWHFQVLKMAFYNSNTLFLRISHIHILIPNRFLLVKLWSSPPKSYFHSPLEPFWLTMTTFAKSLNTL